ncbi:protein-L-isoaspartate(D-aspartate) O-methyltransferase [Sphingomonas gilva]|uniref:Protein-L-isoaspartate O-methyltransferase n=1 Tax=Sphingomonas gilva TaxID=2305907 RepID=A0A396RNU2_9SPHN|nr:protein-L-isoaspartate(D-aspartate) O-methyltransferase [Sphingomonas gilva]RHW17446.1 protein-L-isoaspartate(D-aspartate) O-methyltransferase [Sphingomonas gilva]
MADTGQARAEMVDRQIAARGIRDERLLAAMREVPRDLFVGEERSAHAHDDSALPIAAGQTISQPYIVAAMIEAARVGRDDRVLEIGAGSGYAAAVMGRLAREVHAVERLAELAELAAGRMAGLGYANVHIHQGDGTGGWPDAAPFDAILVSAAGPDVPQPLIEQLAPGGRLVMPVGGGHVQSLVRVTRDAAGAVAREKLDDVCFVPLIGAHGWPER